jgi:hypothetical protein
MFRIIYQLIYNIERPHNIEPMHNIEDPHNIEEPHTIELLLLGSYLIGKIPIIGSTKICIMCVIKFWGWGGMPKNYFFKIFDKIAYMFLVIKYQFKVLVKIWSLEIFTF